MSDERNRLDRWSEVYAKTEGAPPSAMLVQAVGLVGKKANALDLGCGVGRDTRFLLDLGFTVTAIDIDPQAQLAMSRLPHQDRFRYVHSTFKDFQPETYQLINAQWSLPYVDPDAFDPVFKKVIGSLEPGGVFTGQLFGVNDSWNASGLKFTFHTEDAAMKLFNDMELVEFNIVDSDGVTARGNPKHWHVFHIIARKPT